MLPDYLFVERVVGQALAVQDLGMHADDQHLFVIGAVEDPDAPAFREALRGAPEKVVFQLGRARMLEAEHLAPLRIDAGHQMANCTVLAGRVHGLEDQ